MLKLPKRKTYGQAQTPKGNLSTRELFFMQFKKLIKK